MFDFAWSEIALIAAVALIAIGPKDMPVAIRSVTSMIKKARRMASEFQTHVDEMVREANLQEVRDSISDIRNFNIRDEIEKNIDPDGSLRGTFDTNPLMPDSTGEPAAAAEAEPALAGEQAVAELERRCEASPGPEPPRVTAPAFIPPSAMPPPEAEAQPAPVGEPEAPAFIPPGVVLQHRSRSAG